VNIVSGAAYGIDGMAHRGALAAGGVTTAWLAGGVERAYPAGHRDLLERIVAAGGAVVSEVPCGSAPTKWRFLSRNRLIAAAADATVVVEAGWRSGSLNTASHAATLGRPLGAVPGPVTSAASAGCHRLLREFDGVCVTGSDDIRELLGMDRPGVLFDEGRTDDHTRVCDALSTRVDRSAADIARRAGMATDEATAVLGLLELEGRVTRGARGWRASSRR
jgi:DNA processing protein